MIRDLEGRLCKLHSEAEAFETIIKPNGHHTVSLLRRIRDVEGFAQIIVRREAGEPAA